MGQKKGILSGKKEGKTKTGEGDVVSWHKGYGEKETTEGSPIRERG